MTRARRPGGWAWVGAAALAAGLATTAAAQSAARAWLGVELAASKVGHGVLARHVTRTSPADRAGVHDGDVITRVGSREVNAPSDVIEQVRAHQPGDGLELWFEHAGRPSSVRVTLAAFPGSEEMLRADKLGTFAPPLDGLQTVRGAMPGAGPPRGRVTVVDFWASWCGVCKMTTPVLNRWYAKYASQGVAVVGVSNDPMAVAAKAVEGFGIQYPAGVDHDDKVFTAYGVSALPTMYVIDKRGVVRDVGVGYDPAHFGQVEALLQRLIAEPP